MVSLGEAGLTATSTASSQGVDLFELERLRVLVRFEFDRELTRDELVVALTRCHNNTREAYHFLKEQRRQAQLAAAAEMVAAAAVASAYPAQGATSVHQNTNGTNGVKRRGESEGFDEGDVQMDTPNKRHRSGIEAATVDLSHEDADMTQATQNSIDNDHTGQRQGQIVDQDRAIRIISDIVDQLTQATSSMVDEEQWLSTVAEAFAFHRTPDVDAQLVIAVEALANALKHISSSDRSAVRSDGVVLIQDVLTQLPRHDQYDLELRLRPSEEVMNKDLEEVENSYACALVDDISTSQRAQAARNAITVIKNACVSCITRQESILDSVKAAQFHRRRIRARLEGLRAGIHSRLEQAGRDVRISENDMDQARGDRSRLTVALMDVVKKKKDSLLAQGEDEDDATLEAHKAVVCSTDDDVVKLRSERDESQLHFRARKEDVIRANTRLEFYQKLEALRQKVVPQVQHWIEVSMKKIELLKSAAERTVEEKLRLYVPKMTQSLRLYYDFHTLRQQRATRDREEQQQSLAEHMEVYEDLVPSSKKEIENKIREFNGVIVYSTQLMREVASMQCELWEGKRKLFSPKVFSIVQQEYGQLWSSLSGGAKDMMLDCVKMIRHEANDSIPSNTTSPSRVTEAPAPAMAVTPFEFVTKELDWRRELQGRTSAHPTSPMVDLTADDDGDDVMDGERGSIAPATGSPQIVRFGNADVNEPIGFTVFKAEATREIDSVVPSLPREFPTGARLCWKLKDDQGEMGGLYRGRVKGRTDGGSYVLEDDGGNEHTIPTSNLFTEEEMGVFLSEERIPNEEHHREGCSIM